MLTEKMILSKYPKYSSISKLKKLDIWGEEIEDISILSQMPNLQVLSLSSNKISSLSPLSSCLNLRRIFLRNNNIYSFEELYHLKNLSHLTALWLEDNPISKDIFYANKVAEILPNLQFLDNKNLLINKIEKKHIVPEEHKQIKNQYDLDTNLLKCNRKKILLRRVFSYLEPSNDGGGYAETSNDTSLGQNKKLKKVDLSELKLKFNTKGKSVKKERKLFKKIKLKIKSDNIHNNNLFNNFMMYNNYFGNGPRLSEKKLTVDTHPNDKILMRENNTVQNSIIQQNSSESKEKKEFKIKKISFFGNKRKNLYLYKYNKYKYNDKISININGYENDNKELMKAVYVLVDQMNLQNLLSLKEVINKKLSTFNK